jgi:hypothetical protein
MDNSQAVLSSSDPPLFFYGLICVVHGFEFFLGQFNKIRSQMRDFVRVIFAGHAAICPFYLSILSRWINFKYFI